MSDSPFEFSMGKLKEYVSNADLSAIAITNHNVFCRIQYESIRGDLPITVFPGIEVDVEGCHVLLILDEHGADRLQQCSDDLSGYIKSPEDSVSYEQMAAIFGDLSNYLVIPHYEKKPAIKQGTLEKLADYVTAGEVDSAKKFIRCAKDTTRLTPVLFSDARMKEDLPHLPSRATYIDCGDLSLSSLRHSLSDSKKVALSAEDGNGAIQILDDGLKISTGLNVLLGDRSSGKTYTLDRIFKQNEEVKYIRQFSLVQVDEKKCQQEFEGDIERRKSRFADEYLSGFKTVVEKVSRIDLALDDSSVGKYLDTLIESARNADRQDAFSKSRLFNETTIKVGDDDSVKTLIKAVRHLIENVDHKDIIERHVDINKLKSLACELIETLWANELKRLKFKHVNQIIRDVKQGLAVRSSSTQIEDVDLYEVALNKKKVSRFNEIAKSIQAPRILHEEPIQGFKVVARRSPYAGAGELKSASGRKVAFSNAWRVYDNPYEFLQELFQIDSIPDTEWHKYFAKIEYEVLNSDGFPVSGGERSEFRLLREISDSQKYSMLLLDEPESSFDNTFLSSNVNSLIRDISRQMPVIVVTHNSTVGASIGADFLLYANKERVGDDIEYRLYSGHPADRKLRSSCGAELSNFQAQMNALEAGIDTYNARRRNYENIKD